MRATKGMPVAVREHFVPTLRMEGDSSAFARKGLQETPTILKDVKVSFPNAL